MHFRGKGYPLTGGKQRRRFQIKPKEKKAEVKEKRRQLMQQHAENRKLIAQGIITKEDLQRAAAERKAELHREKEEQAAKNPTAQAGGGTGG